MIQEPPHGLPGCPRKQMDRQQMGEAAFTGDKLVLCLLFLAVQDSSIGDFFTHSLTHSLIDF